VQQALQWLQHIKRTPVTDLDNIWAQRVVGIQCWWSSWLEKQIAVGRLPSEAGHMQQLLPVFQLLCETVLQLLRQAPGVAPKQQQLAGGTSTDQASSSSSNSSSSNGTATDPGPAASMLHDLLHPLVTAVNSWVVCNESYKDDVAAILKGIGGLCLWRFLLDCSFLSQL
jgi:hypothetical protein